jgi:predicted component of type VI protein secretion system
VARTRSKKPPKGKSLYADLFAEAELAELERTANNPLLEDEIGLLRMLIRRLAAEVLNSVEAERSPADKIKAVRELTEILLSALKARHQLTPHAEDNLAEAMRQVLQEIEEENGSTEGAGPGDTP